MARITWTRGVSLRESIWVAGGFFPNGLDITTPRSILGYSITSTGGSTSSEGETDGELYLYDLRSEDWWFTSESIYPSFYSFGREDVELVTLRRP